jgi:hypothetical protein
MRNQSERAILTPLCAGIHLLLLAVLLITAGPVLAEEAEDASEPAKLFTTNDTLDIKIFAPWLEIERNERFQGTYPAKIEFTDELGNSHSIEATVERRGITRQQVCRYPPIKLRFEKDKVKGSTFRGQDSLKMVTHCEKSTRFEQYYLLEMLAYRMYNLITDYSFRVRPLSVTYADSKKGKSDGPRFAFLIEDDGDVAKRHDLKKLEIPKVKSYRLDSQVGSDFALFQYMIGNVDWAALSGPDPKECCHNVKLIAPRPLEPDDVIFPVPYDFDSSGLVDAHYAAPPNGLGINSVTQRLYRGYCVHNGTLENSRQGILAQESAIYALIDDENRLKSGNAKSAKKYLAKFFDIMKDPEDFEKLITGRCRK